jgi:hypothetical protein
MAYLGSMSTTTYTLGNQRVFFGPWLDFLFMGGGSLIALPLLAALIPDSAMPQVGFAVLVLAVIINHPHFAHSYQIFYANYREIMRAPRTDPVFRRRYLFSGVGIPALLIGYFALTLALSEPAMVRYSVNAMMFFVGWHYVKQGFGLLMVDAAIKKSFFSQTARNVLLVNAYVCWAASWLLVNRVIAAQDFLGLAYYTIPVPDQAMLASFAALGLTSLASLLVLLQHAREHGAAFPLTGTAAYVAALYVWLFMSYDPELGALIPAFHSIQYLYLVWRYRLNVEAAEPDAALPVEVMNTEIPVERRHVRFARYILSGTLLGVIGFWVIPAGLDHYMAYDKALFGDNLFLVMVWVFINVHHFFIDTAMWRKENPHTLHHLFSHN